MTTLKDVCEKSSSNIKQSDLQDHNGAYPIFGASGFLKNVDFYQQDKPYVAVVKDGAGVGRVMRLPAYSSVLGTMQYIIPRDGTNADYLAYAMERMNLAKYRMGATIPHIYFRDYCHEELPNHSAREQEEIAAVLNQVNGLVALRKRQLETLDKLLKARFVELFGDPDTNEKGLPVCKLGDICNIGSSKRVYQQEQSSMGVPFLRVSDLVGLIETNVLRANLFISKERYNDFLKERLVPKSGDILVTSRGTIGKCYIVKDTDTFYFQDGMISWLHNFDSSVTSLYISFLFSMPGFQKQIQTLQAGSTVAYLSIAMLNKLNIMLPDIRRQERFAAFARQCDQSKRAFRKGLKKLETLKAALMRKYFNPGVTDGG